MRNGELVAVHHADGSVRWTIKQAATVSPVPAGHALIVADGNTVVAIDTSSGKTLWLASPDAPVTVTPVATEAVIFVATASGRAIGLDPASGRQVWSAELGAAIRANPGVAGDVIYAPLEDGRVMALNLKDGHLIWVRKLGGAPADPQPAGDRVFVGSKDKYFYCLAASSGRVKWRWRTGGDLVGRPLVDPRDVVFLSLDNLLRDARRGNGNMRWKTEVDSRPIGSPLRADDLILVATVSQDILAYKAATGRPSGTVTVPERLMGVPFFAAAGPQTPSRLVVLTATGRLQALGATVEPTIVPLDFLPGTRLAPETLPSGRGPGRPS